MNMKYRPSIFREVDERVALYVAGKQGAKNDVYETAVKMMLDTKGNERPGVAFMQTQIKSNKQWVQLLYEYCDETEQNPEDVMNEVMTQLFDEDGEVNIKFKERLGLE